MMKRDKIKITWYMDDGYAGGSRPQYSSVDREEYNACETELEKEKLIFEIVQQDYDQKGFYIDSVEA